MAFEFLRSRSIEGSVLTAERSGPAVLTESPVVAMAAKPLVEKDEMVEYAKVAKELGFTSPQMVEQQVLQFCQENNISIYPNAEVVKYMNKRFKAESEYLYAGWGWHPLREKENRLMNASNYNWAQFGHSYGGGRCSISAPYKAAIPLPVLLTAQRIEKGVPGIVGFVVAAQCERTLKGDPFLGVLCHFETAPIIVERWDEPGFRRK